MADETKPTQNQNLESSVRLGLEQEKNKTTNADQRIFVVRQIIQSEQAKPQNQDNFNLSLLQGILAGEKTIRMPSGKSLSLLDFNPSTGIARFKTQGDRTREVNINLSTLYRNLRNQNIIENLPEKQRKFMQETFGDTGDKKQIRFQSDFFRPHDVNTEELVRSLGLPTPQTISEIAQQVALEIHGDTQLISETMAHFPPGVITPDILNQTVETIINAGENAAEQVQSLKELIQDNRDSRLIPFLEQQLKQAERLAALSHRVRESKIANIISAYQSIASGDSLRIKQLTSATQNLVNNPDLFDIHELTSIFGISVPTAFGPIESLKTGLQNAIQGKIGVQLKAQFICSYLTARILAVTSI